MPVAGTLLEAVGGVYRVLVDPGASAPETPGSDDGYEVEAFLRGRLKQETRTGDRLVAGDRVILGRDGDGAWTIDEVTPRRTELLRGGLGGRKARIVAANVDQALVVVAIRRPDLREELLDRFLVLAELSGVPPVVVLNKVDLEGGVEIAAGAEKHLAGCGYPVVRASALTGEGVEAVGEHLRGKTTVVMGPSGVGKSSLLNRIAPEFELRTGAVSERKGGGRHTTVSTRLLPLVGEEGGPPVGWVVDTPGFSEAEGWRPSEDELAHAFPELRERAPECRFRACSHLHEPGCAVLEDLDAGALNPARYRSYRRLVTRAG